MVVALAAPEEPLDLGHEPRPARRLVSRSRGSPSAPAGSRRRPARFASAVELARASRASAPARPSPTAAAPTPRREALEPEPRGVDLLQVLAGQPADERAARRPPTSTRPSRSSAESPIADGRLRDAEPLARGRAARAAFPRRAARSRSARAAACATRCSIEARPIGSISSSGSEFTPARSRCMLGGRDLRFHVATDIAWRRR